VKTGSSVATVVESFMRKKSSTFSWGVLVELFGCELRARRVSSGVMLSFSLTDVLWSISVDEHLGLTQNSFCESKECYAFL